VTKKFWMRQSRFLLRTLRSFQHNPSQPRHTFHISRRFIRGRGDGTREDLNSAAYSRGSIGYGFAAPPELRDIVKLELLEEQTNDEIKNVWLKQYRNDESRISYAFNEEQWEKLKSRLKESKLFIYPTPWKQKYFVLLSQMQEKHLFFVPAELFHRDPTTASPYVSISFYDDFLYDKGLILARAEISALAHVTRDSMLFLMGEFFHYYQDDEAYELVKQFNYDSNNFDLQGFIEKYPFTQHYFVKNEKVGKLFVREVQQDGSIAEADDETAENEEKVLKSHVGQTIEVN